MLDCCDARFALSTRARGRHSKRDAQELERHQLAPRRGLERERVVIFVGRRLTRRGGQRGTCRDGAGSGGHCRGAAGAVVIGVVIVVVVVVVVGKGAKAVDGVSTGRHWTF